MVPFHEICPKLAFDECRMLIVPQGHRSELPPDRYDLEESYCVEPACDCRRVMLNVTSVSRRQVEAVISFGFDVADPLRGPFLDPLNPQSPHAEALLDLVRQQVLTDPQYVQRLERHYQIVRDIVAGRLRPDEATPAATLLGPTVVGVGMSANYGKPEGDVAENVTPFDIHQNLFDEDGESDEGEVEEYIDGLMNQFADSSEAEPIFKAGLRLGWAGSMMHYAFGHLGVAPTSMALAEFREVVYQIIPRKVSVEADRAEEIVTELRAFWSFLQRSYGLKNAAEILRDLDANAVERLHDELDDSTNFGMAKSIFGLGRQAGFDMTTQEGLAKFMLAYNSGLLGGRRLGPPPAPRRELSMFDDNAIAEEFGNRADRRAAKRAQRREAKKRQRGRR